MHAEVLMACSGVDGRTIDITVSVGIGDNLTMMEGIMHIIKEVEKKERPQNASLRNSGVNRV